MNKKHFQVFGLGQCSLDYIGKAGSFPLPDAKCEFTDMVIQGGGPVATALVALARWNVSCGFSGVLGDDMFGSLIRESLVCEGIDTRGIVIRKGCDSQFAFIVAEPGLARRTVFWRRPTGLPLKLDEVDRDCIRNSKILHTDGLFIEASLEACRTAKKSGVPVVVDAGSLREGMLDIAKMSDYFIASEILATPLVGPGKPLEACYKLAALGPRVAAVTLGSKGYVALVGDKVIQRPAYQVKAVDTTGCGDVFHAGFIYGLLQGWDIEKCLDRAAWVAAMVSLEIGGRTNIVSIE